METLTRSRSSITVVTANGKVQTNEEAQVFVQDLHIFVSVQLLEDTCKKHGYTFEWPSGRFGISDTSGNKITETLYLYSIP